MWARVERQYTAETNALLAQKWCRQRQVLAAGFLGIRTPGVLSGVMWGALDPPNKLLEGGAKQNLGDFWQIFAGYSKAKSSVLARMINS